MWLKLDDVFHRHRKVAPLSDRAWRLHVTALLECCAHRTDGKIERKLPPTWPAAPRGRVLTEAIKELVDAGLWEETESGWTAHDFLDWNPSSAEVQSKSDARADAGRKGGKRTAKSKQTGKQLLEQNDSKTDSKTEAKFNPVPVPVPVPKEEDLPHPPRKPRDPFGDSLRQTAPGDREDVKRLFERFKRAIDRPGLAFFGPHCADAATLADALEAHGETDCGLVADEARNDRMVTGEADDRGMDHRSVRYVFGNAAAFARILAAAKKKLEKTKKKSLADVFDEAMAAEPEGA